MTRNASSLFWLRRFGRNNHPPHQLHAVCCANTTKDSAGRINWKASCTNHCVRRIRFTPVERSWRNCRAVCRTSILDRLKLGDLRGTSGEIEEKHYPGRICICCVHFYFTQLLSRRCQSLFFGPLKVF